VCSTQFVKKTGNMNDYKREEGNMNDYKGEEGNMNDYKCRSGACGMGWVEGGWR
jgi:hypothetical protein